MAVIHEERHGDSVYQVRTAGSSIRLYTNGVFHSQFSPSPRAATNMWDLLSMPALLARGGRPASVLVLGVGGGAVLRRMVDTFDVGRVVGVELDPVHLSIGRRFFGLERDDIELVVADARGWVADYRGKPFDLVIDDLFGHGDGEPRRALAFDKSWLRRLDALVSPHGAVAANFASLAEYRHSAASSREGAGDRWRAGYTLRLRVLDNVVSVHSRERCSTESFRGLIAKRFGTRALACTSVRGIPATTRR